MKPIKTLFAHPAIVIAGICILIFVGVIATQADVDVAYNDNYWYLNRMYLIWQGILRDFWGYAVGYPTVGGVINFVVNDVVLSGMITNAILLGLLLYGTYTLGIWLFERPRTAWLAVLLVVLNVSVLDRLRLFWALMPFMSAVVWCVTLCVLVIRRPTILNAILFGVVLAVAMYTRFEGTTYAILLPIAAGVVYLQRKNLRLALQVLIAGGLVAGVLAMPLMLNFLYIRQNIDTKLAIDVTGILPLIRRTPLDWSIIWRRATDTFTSMLSHWSALAWLLWAGGILWGAARYRTTQIGIAALVGFNLIVAFILAIWTFPNHVIYFLPFVSLSLVVTLDQLIRRGGWLKWLAAAFVAITVLPGIIHYVRLATAVPFLDYRNSETAQNFRAMDEYITAQGWQDKHIYTLCESAVVFSRSDLELIYRLQFTTGWDAYERLVPQMAQEAALVMECGTNNNLPDWSAMLKEGFPGLEEVGRFDRYVFYRPVEAS